MINILIITHGEFGREMLRTAETIVGKQAKVFVLGVTHGDSLTTMCERTGEILKNIDDPDGTLILTDMMGGTPCNACLPFSTDHKIEIVAGINLYMLLSSFMNRGSMPVAALSSKVIGDGQKNIANVKELFLKRLG
jgi:PTS system mannose-specific IIA component